MKTPKLILYGNIYKNWKDFITEFNILLTTEEYVNKRDKFKVQVLLDCIGNEGYEFYKTFKSSLKDLENGSLLNKVIEKFDHHYSSFKNVENYNIYLFNKRVQGEDESFDHFLKDIEEIAAFCKFGPMRRKLILNKVISGIAWPDLKNVFLKIEDPVLDNIVTRCKIYEDLKNTINDCLGNRETNSVREEKTKEVASQDINPGTSKNDEDSAPPKEKREARVLLKLEGAPKKREEEPFTNLLNEIPVVKKEVFIQRKIKKYSCPRCDKIFCGKGYLKNHMITKHSKFFKREGFNLKRFNKIKKFKTAGNGLETLICDDCGKKFTMKKNLEDHINSHLNGKPFNCSMCNKTFFQKDEFIQHISRKH